METVREADAANAAAQAPRSVGTSTLSLLVGTRPGRVARGSAREIPGPTQATPAAAEQPVGIVADRGALRRITLRFVDEGLERGYQLHGGAEGQTGFRITIGAAATLWLLAAVVVPMGTPISLDGVVPLCVAMTLLNWSALLFSADAVTL